MIECAKDSGHYRENCSWVRPAKSATLIVAFILAVETKRKAASRRLFNPIMQLG